MNWQPVVEELDAWSAAGAQARFWLRDDDAIEPSDELDALLELTGRHNVPVLLAVIPSGAGGELAKRLEFAEWVSPVVHGWAHVNHAPKNQKSQELGLHRTKKSVLDELTAALDKLRTLFPRSLKPVLVPPWNRIDGDLIPYLPGLGYRALSAFGRKPLANGIAGLVEIHTHVDLIDWKGTRGCRDHSELIDCVATELALSRRDNGAPIGILSHHLVHNQSVADFLEELFELVVCHSGSQWVRAETLVD